MKTHSRSSTRRKCKNATTANNGTKSCKSRKKSRVATIKAGSVLLRLPLRTQSMHNSSNASRRSLNINKTLKFLRVNCKERRRSNVWLHCSSMLKRIKFSKMSYAICTSSWKRLRSCQSRSWITLSKLVSVSHHVITSLWWITMIKLTNRCPRSTSLNSRTHLTGPSQTRILRAKTAKNPRMKKDRVFCRRRTYCASRFRITLLCSTRSTQFTSRLI